MTARRRPRIALHRPTTRRPGLALDRATALVTGATGGLGQAIARALATRGTSVLLSGRRADALGELGAELGARWVVGDLSRAQDVARIGDEAAAAGVDVLVANAALPATGQLAALTMDEIDRMLAVNLRASIALTHRLAPEMAARGRGALVFVSSLSGQVASPASSLYSATKFGLRGFALGLRQDLGPRGVGVSLVIPGFVRDAGMYADAGVALPPGVGTSTPCQVALAVLRAIERAPAQVYVAPMSLRVGTALASIAPVTAARVARLVGSDAIAERFAERQRDRR
ncbi:MAG: SDR family NAD(P)-dependent oxidoreductase [Solirubrobacterales bacterium]|nr:SDR family NAD(P)-dependent oxidoreductase [Solirubrobacterales bacterium]